MVGVHILKFRVAQEFLEVAVDGGLIQRPTRRRLRLRLRHRHTLLFRRGGGLLGRCELLLKFLDLL